MAKEPPRRTQAPATMRARRIRIGRAYDPRRPSARPVWSDLKEPAEREPRADGAEEQPGGDEAERIHGEGDRVDVAAAVQVAEDRGQGDCLPAHEQDDREHRPDEPLEEPFEHERA